MLRDSVQTPFTGTMLFNPIMGHVQLACTTPLFAPGLVGSLRYDVNLHSFDADLVAGLLYAPHSETGTKGAGAAPNPERASPAADPATTDAGRTDRADRPPSASTSALRLRASWRHGLALSVLSQLMDGTIGVELGVSTGPLLAAAGSGTNISIPRPVFPVGPSIGISLSLGS